MLLILYVATIAVNPVEMETVTASEMAASRVTGFGGAMAGKKVASLRVILNRKVPIVIHSRNREAPLVGLRNPDVIYKLRIVP